MRTARWVAAGAAMVLMVGCGVQRASVNGTAPSVATTGSSSPHTTSKASQAPSTATTPRSSSPSSTAPIIVWNRQSPVSAPTTGALADPRVAAISTVSDWVITDQFRFHGIKIAGAESTVNAAQAAIIVTHHGVVSVHRLPDGTGAAVITSWNAYNAQGKKIPPSLVYFATLNGVAGSVQLARGTMTWAAPHVFPDAATEHLPSGTWSDGQWYDAQTGMFGPRVVSVVTQGQNVTVIVGRVNNSSDPQTTFTIPGVAGDLQITGIDSSGTLVTLRGGGLAGSLNLVTGKWQPALDPKS